MSYQRERDQFIARMASEGLPLYIITMLLRAATTLQRYAEMSCSSERADRDTVLCPGMQRTADCLCDDWPVGSHAAGKHQRVPRHVVKEHQLEARLSKLVSGVPGWAIDTQGDPRGYVLRVIPPSYAERNAGCDRFNLDTIGVPARETGLRF